MATRSLEEIETRMGDAREVRVFDVSNVKGMEFEAVFFVGVDALKRRLPDLLHASSMSA